MNDDNLEHLVVEMDDKLLEWATVNKLPPASMMAILLARMTMVAQVTDSEGEFLATLIAAQNTIMKKDEDEEKVVH